MTVRIAVQALKLPNDRLEKMLGLYAAEKGSRHTPSVTTVKMVLVALSIRQRKRSDLGCDGDVVNESVPQIMAYWNLKKSTVDDALAFLTWSGVVRTIKKGGGRGKNPTIRQVYFDGFESGKREIHDGEPPLHDGESELSDGETFEQDGELPDTPLVKPITNPLCKPLDEYPLSENELDLDQLIEFYEPFTEWIDNTHFSDSEFLRNKNQTPDSFIKRGPEMRLQLAQVIGDVSNQWCFNEQERSLVGQKKTNGGQFHGAPTFERSDGPPQRPSRAIL